MPVPRIKGEGIMRFSSTPRSTRQLFPGQGKQPVNAETRIINFLVSFLLLTMWKPELSHSNQSEARPEWSQGAASSDEAFASIHAWA
jgi:hypothetical protein